jgi:hypothetical protein
MQTHSWRKEGSSEVARVAVGDLVQLELRVTAAAWWIVVDGSERARGVCTSVHNGRQLMLDELSLQLGEARAKVEAWLFEIYRR